MSASLEIDPDLLRSAQPEARAPRGGTDLESLSSARPEPEAGALQDETDLESYMTSGPGSHSESTGMTLAQRVYEQQQQQQPQPQAAAGGLPLAQAERGLGAPLPERRQVIDIDGSESDEVDELISDGEEPNNRQRPGLLVDATTGVATGGPHHQQQQPQTGRQAQTALVSYADSLSSSSSGTL